MLHRWVREYEGNPSKVTGSKNEAVSSGDFDQMRRELAKVRTERDILKKGARLLRSRPQVKYALLLVTAAYGLRVPRARF